MLSKSYFIFYLSVHFAVLVSTCKSTHLLNNFFKFWYYVFVVILTERNRQIHIPIKYFVFNYEFVQYLSFLNYFFFANLTINFHIVVTKKTCSFTKSKFYIMFCLIPTDPFSNIDSFFEYKLENCCHSQLFARNKFST